MVAELRSSKTFIYSELVLKQYVRYILSPFPMRLTFSTDYALRLLMLVGLQPNRLVTIEEVADRFDISKNHLMK